MRRNLVVASAAALLALGAPQVHAETRLVWPAPDAAPPPAGAKSVVFLSAGYARDAQESFQSDVASAVDRLKKDDASFVKQLPGSFRFYGVFEAADAANPWTPPPFDGDLTATTAPAPLYRLALPGTDDGKTPVLRATLAAGPFVRLDADLEKAELAAAARAVGGRVDAFVVLIRGDASGYMPVVDTTGDTPRVYVTGGMERYLLHELAHALYSLGDEYGDDASAFPADDSSASDAVARFKNLSLDPSGFQAISSSPAFEGGAGYGHGVWHCEPRCRMGREGTDADTSPFCAACTVAIYGVAKTPPGRPSVGGGLDDGTPYSKQFFGPAGGSIPLAPTGPLATSFEFRFAPAGSDLPSSWTSLATPASAVPVDDLTDQTTYKLEVRARNANGTSPTAWIYFRCDASLATIVPTTVPPVDPSSAPPVDPSSSGFTGALGGN